MTSSLSRLEQRSFAIQLACALSIVVIARKAWAGGSGNFEAESEALILMFARWFQRITTILAIIAIVEAGSRFWSDEKSQGARAHMKNVLIGCAICFGAIGITEILKASFSGRI